MKKNCYLNVFNLSIKTSKKVNSGGLVYFEKAKVAPL
jgi:hypothetical protein